MADHYNWDSRKRGIRNNQSKKFSTKKTYLIRTGLGWLGDSSQLLFISDGQRIRPSFYSSRMVRGFVPAFIRLRWLRDSSQLYSPRMVKGFVPAFIRLRWLGDLPQLYSPRMVRVRFISGLFPLAPLQIQVPPTNL